MDKNPSQDSLPLDQAIQDLKEHLLSRLSERTAIEKLLDLGNYKTFTLRLLLLNYLFLNPKSSPDKIPTITEVCNYFKRWTPRQIPYDLRLDTFFSSPDYGDKICGPRKQVRGVKNARNPKRLDTLVGTQLMFKIDEGQYLLTEAGRELALFLYFLITSARHLFEHPDARERRGLGSAFGSLDWIRLKNQLRSLAGEQGEELELLEQLRLIEPQATPIQLTEFGEVYRDFLEKYQVMLGGRLQEAADLLCDLIREDLAKVKQKMAARGELLTDEPILSTDETQIDWIIRLKLMDEKQEIRSADDLLQDPKSFVLMGQLGTGKTIFLVQLLELLLDKNYCANIDDSPVIPLRLPLRQLFKIPREGDIETELDYFGERIRYFTRLEDIPIETSVPPELVPLLLSLIKGYLLHLMQQSKPVAVSSLEPIIRQLWEQNHFLLLFDGWDELPPECRAIILQLITGLLKEKRLIGITCRPPLDPMLEKVCKSFDVPIYRLRSPTRDEKDTYVATRHRHLNAKLDVSDLVEQLEKVFGVENVSPFHLYAFTLLPLKKIPRNSAELFRWFVYISVFWEVFKFDLSPQQSITNISEVLSLLQSRQHVIGNQAFPVTRAIEGPIPSRYPEILTDASLLNIVGWAAYTEISRNFKELPATKVLELNSLSEIFVDQIVHPKGLYPILLVKQMQLRSYFAAEFILRQLLNGVMRPLLTAEVLEYFYQLLMVDDRWQDVAARQNLGSTPEQVIAQYVIAYPIDIVPSVHLPQSGMLGETQLVLARMPTGVPKFFVHLIEAVIHRFSEISLSSPRSADLIHGLIELLKNVPEETSDFVHDLETYDIDVSSSVSASALEYVPMAKKVFPEYRQACPAPLSRVLPKTDICELCASRKEWEDAKKRDPKFLVSILETSSSTPLKKWAHEALQNLYPFGLETSFELIKTSQSVDLIFALLARWDSLTRGPMNDNGYPVLPRDDITAEEAASLFLDLRSKQLPAYVYSSFFSLILRNTCSFNFVSFVFRQFESIRAPNLYESFIIAVLDFLYSNIIASDSDRARSGHNALYPTIHAGRSHLMECHWDKWKHLTTKLPWDMQLSLVRRGYPLPEPQITQMLTDWEDPQNNWDENDSFNLISAALMQRIPVSWDTIMRCLRGWTWSLAEKIQWLINYSTLEWNFSFSELRRHFESFVEPQEYVLFGLIDNSDSRILNAILQRFLLRTPIREVESSKAVSKRIFDWIQSSEIEKDNFWEDITPLIRNRFLNHLAEETIELLTSLFKRKELSLEHFRDLFSPFRHYTIERRARESLEFLKPLTLCSNPVVINNLVSLTKRDENFEHRDDIIIICLLALNLPSNQREKVVKLLLADLQHTSPDGRFFHESPLLLFLLKHRFYQLLEDAIPQIGRLSDLNQILTALEKHITFQTDFLGITTYLAFENPAENLSPPEMTKIRGLVDLCTSQFAQISRAEEFEIRAYFKLMLQLDAKLHLQRRKKLISLAISRVGASEELEEWLKWVQGSRHSDLIPLVEETEARLRKELQENRNLKSWDKEDFEHCIQRILLARAFLGDENAQEEAIEHFWTFPLKNEETLVVLSWIDPSKLSALVSKAWKILSKSQEKRYRHRYSQQKQMVVVVITVGLENDCSPKISKSNANLLLELINDPDIRLRLITLLWNKKVLSTRDILDLAVPDWDEEFRDQLVHIVPNEELVKALKETFSDLKIQKRNWNVTRKLQTILKIWTNLHASPNKLLYELYESTESWDKRKIITQQAEELGLVNFVEEHNQLVTTVFQQKGHTESCYRIHELQIHKFSDMDYSAFFASYDKQQQEERLEQFLDQLSTRELIAMAGECLFGAQIENASDDRIIVRKWTDKSTQKEFLVDAQEILNKVTMKLRMEETVALIRNHDRLNRYEQCALRHYLISALPADKLLEFVTFLTLEERKNLFRQILLRYLIDPHPELLRHINELSDRFS